MNRSPGGSLAAAIISLFASAGLAVGAPDGPGPTARPPLVALLSTLRDDPLAGRLDAELRAIGLGVVRVPVSPIRVIDQQVQEELAGRARAAVVVANGHRIEIWIAARGSDGVGLREQIEVSESSGLEARSILAVRAVEFLRIGLLVPGSGGGPIAMPPADGRIAPSSSSPLPRRWLAIAASSGVLASVGGVGPMAIAGLSLRGQVAGLVGAELCAFVPLTDSALVVTDGRVRTSVWLAGGGVLLAPQLDQWVSLDVALGTLAALVRSTGTPTPPGVGRTDEQVGMTLYARAAARFRLARHLALRLDIFGGSALRRPVVSIMGGRDIASWGTAFGVGLGGVELRF